ncbi:hypothetical protein B0H16DRAFT_1518215 [Mycena metata]|uniref:Uncharacterized protein n=1 Tax=Mycena metata TaxID=1033252 RepID=A0AAD7JRR2_9AGAR|nr:hypothetical protein B0H16DRAFT_1518215 [Mycena metata]
MTTFSSYPYRVLKLRTTIGRRRFKRKGTVFAMVASPWYTVHHITVLDLSKSHSLHNRGLFYGIYLVLFSISMYLLVRQHIFANASHEPHKEGPVLKSTVFVSAILLFAVITAHWTATIYRAFIGFVSIQVRFEAESVFSNFARPSAVAQDTFLALSFVVGDSMIISRLWVVWAHSKRVLVVPILTLTAFAVGCFISTSVVAHNPNIFSDPWLKYTPILTLITNVYCTFFIGWKIWTVTRSSSPSGETNLRVRDISMVDSHSFDAALPADWINFRLWAVLFVVAFKTKLHLQSIIIQAGPELIGLVNALIMTRVGLGWMSEHIEETTHQSVLAFAVSGDSER